MRRSKYSNQNQDPRIITASFKSQCAETGVTIAKGNQCVYYPSSKQVYAMDSKQATEFKKWKSDISMGFDY